MRISDWSSDVCSSDLDLPRPAKDSQTAEALAGSRVASWRRRAYRRWGISPRPEDVLLWWITGGIRRRDSSIRAAAGRMLESRRRIPPRSEEHTSELQSLMRTSYAVFCLQKKTRQTSHHRCAYSHPHYASTNKDKYRP